MITLITYGDHNFTNSLWLIKQQARRLGLFDRIRLYTPRDLPAPMRALPVMMYRRGGGFMTWKPYVLSHALSQSREGDIVIFVDAGCCLRPGDEWQQWFELLRDHDSLFYEYRSDYDYHWERWGHNSVRIRHWSKPATIDYFRQYFDDDSFLERPSAWSGLMMVRKGAEPNPIVKDWLDIATMHPELFADPMGAECLHLPASYCAHRHDQTVLSMLLTYYRDRTSVAIVPETAESQRDTAAVGAVRYRCGRMPLVDTIKFRLYHTLHR